MRTPWRFVADLVSRKPKPHSRDESPTVEAKTIALEYKPVPEEGQSGIGATAVDGSEAQVEASRPEPDTAMTEAGTAASIAAEAPVVAVGDDEPASLTTAQRADKTSTASAGAEAVKGTTKGAPTRRKKVASIVEPVDSIGTALEEAPAVAAGPRSFADEMADLDAEVATLRRQLATKLVEQNAQLRKMLARFDVH
ncbi:MULTISPECIES: hypothetical protein [unclassified Rhizobium]|uniref:hypothetical protein n=1 Tax=unclassified Rhizobium TaxID=2613769 RepID=UPI001613FCBE|nr:MULTISPECIES: hypothetical protein [unclassified Rhizobium]MBB3290501.1 hypothetical protein [Rhizobium sp. BK252]MBB3405181.1 hypothetical protein [Rhizobium sp. BK289]MBB3417828.1 hypothetical protein [Rhizobium sp. BK284]MBB3485707.1 hypothetical protein [Rhizobium sp. BK347]